MIGDPIQMFRGSLLFPICFSSGLFLMPVTIIALDLLGAASERWGDPSGRGGSARHAMDLVHGASQTTSGFTTNVGSGQESRRRRRREEEEKQIRVEHSKLDPVLLL